MTRATYVTRLYRPTKIIPPSSGGGSRTPKKDDVSISAKLLVEEGIVKSGSVNGTWTWLPTGLRALTKLKALVHTAMVDGLGAQEVALPSLTSDLLWRQSGRLDKGPCPPEIMKLTDRHAKELLLSPTCEEAICDLVRAGGTLSPKSLPLRLYQITEKFRDEGRPRGGLLRSRSFLMKDLYTFDTSREAAETTYNQVVQVYGSILSKLNLPWVKAKGGTGTIGGDMSHEFHLLSNAGEDSLIACKKCDEVFNAELVTQDVLISSAANAGGQEGRRYNNASQRCPSCGEGLEKEETAIEVAHAFLLGTKYSTPLNLNVTNSGVVLPVEMGCFGVGVSRLLASAVEVLSTPKELRWPLPIAPFLVAILPPKAGSKEETMASDVARLIQNAFDQRGLGNDVLVDDRTNETLGKRIVDSRKLGIPFIVVCGKMAPAIELHDLSSGSVKSASVEEVLEIVEQVKNSYADL